MIKIFTVPEVAEILRVNKKSLYEQIQQGNLKAVKIGRALRVTEVALDEFIEQGGAGLA